MSISVMSKVWTYSKATRGDLLIMLAIADFANDDGEAWPSLETLQHKSRLCEREVRYSLRRLEHFGELVTLQNKGPRGCNLFRVNIPEDKGATIAGGQELPQGQLLPGEGATIAGGGGITLPPNHHRTIKEPSVTPNPLANNSNNSRSARPRSAQGPSEEFLSFWEKYPRKEAMKPAWKAWEKLKPPLDDVLATLYKAKNQPAWCKGKQYIPLPASWLNAERWDDEL